jgi:hypothetical protein
MENPERENGSCNAEMEEGKTQQNQEKKKTLKKKI